MVPCSFILLPLAAFDSVQDWKQMEIGYVDICRPHSARCIFLLCTYLCCQKHFLVMTLQVSTKEFQKYDIDPDRSGSFSGRSNVG